MDPSSGWDSCSNNRHDDSKVLHATFVKWDRTYYVASSKTFSVVFDKWSLQVTLRGRLSEVPPSELAALFCSCNLSAIVVDARGHVGGAGASAAWFSIFTRNSEGHRD